MCINVVVGYDNLHVYFPCFLKFYKLCFEPEKFVVASSFLLRRALIVRARIDKTFINIGAAFVIGFLSRL